MSSFDPSDAPPTPQERRAVRRPGADVIYRVRRASSPSPAAPVVFLHGLASNMTRWAELTRETTLGEHHDLIRVDLRGHGESMTRRRFDLSVRRYRPIRLRARMSVAARANSGPFLA